MSMGFSSGSAVPKGVVGVWTRTKGLGGVLSPHLKPVLQSPRVYTELASGVVLMAVTRGVVSQAAGARIASVVIGATAAWIERPKTQGA